MTYYVDGAHPDATDTNSGDADHPWRTLRYGLDRVKAGDELTVRAGLYRETIGEVELNGTADAPILISAEPGVTVRPTTIPDTADCLDHERNVWGIPAMEGARILEADQDAWDPIHVEDPNGVHFDLLRPMPTHPVENLDLVCDIVGSNWFDPEAQMIYVHPYGSIDHGVELLSSNKISFRGSDFSIRGFAFDYFSAVQCYDTDHASLHEIQCCGSPVQINGARDSLVLGLVVEQVIKRGETYEWHHQGEGQAIQVNDTSRNTLLMGITARHSWNGASFGGDATRVDRALLYGFPNHNFGVSGNGGQYRHVKAYQSQDSLFLQYGSGCEIRECELERAIVIGGGHSITGKAFTDLTLVDNTIHGGSVNCSNDTTIATSDRNYFITNYWDYRYQDMEAQSLADVRSRFGLELHSVWDNRMLPR